MNQKSILYLPHGGGPLPLMNHPSHKELIQFLTEIPKKLVKPTRIILVTAHWEANPIRVSTALQPSMLFDYYGFPPETYDYQYTAPGDPETAKNIVSTLIEKGISAQEDSERGYDHGTFIPLMMMYPEADIPVIQMSLHRSLNPAMHIKIGMALAQYVNDGALLIGSGLSFHNMSAFRTSSEVATTNSKVFDSWLNHAIVQAAPMATSLLKDWEAGPHARYCHPTEEHLLPLHVCFGAASALGKPMATAYQGQLMNAHISSFMA